MMNQPGGIKLMINKMIILSISLAIVLFLGQGCGNNNIGNESNRGKAISEQPQENNNKQVRVGETKPKNEREAGSNFSKAHNIEHHFFFYEAEAKAEDAIEELKIQGYELTELAKDKDLDGEEYFYFAAIKPLMIEDQVIFDETYGMEEIAKRYKIEYDGWGCEVVK